LEADERSRQDLDAWIDANEPSADDLAAQAFARRHARVGAPVAAQPVRQRLASTRMAAWCPSRG